MKNSLYYFTGVSTMNFPIAVLLLCAILGLFDKMIGGRLGLAEEFDRGMTMMGSLALTMSGVYCFSVMLGRWLAVVLQGVSLPVDPTILVSSVLAVDMGAYSIADTLCQDAAQKIFSGILLASTLGATISFSLPIALGSVKGEGSKTLMTGMVYGIIATPAALIVGGVLSGMGIKELLVSLVPVLLICALLALCIFYGGDRAVRAFGLVGRAINLLAIVLFVLVVIQVFVAAPAVEFVDPALIGEVLTIVFKISVIVCGSFILSNLVLKYLMHPILSLAYKIHVNEFAIIGLLLNLITSVSMFSVFDKMDRRGQLMNAAAAVTSGFVFGGQLAFVASVEGGAVLAFILSKLIGGLVGAAIAMLLSPPYDPDASEMIS